MPPKTAPPTIRKAYISEPITRCPPREKGRIRTLVGKISETLRDEPFLTECYIPSLVTSPEVRAHMRPEHVYLLDRIRVVESDLMLVAADHTSFGIGGEVEMATSLGKPVIIFSRAKRLSRFLTGTPANVAAEAGENGYLRYRDWRDLKPRLLPLVERAFDRSEPMRHLTFWDVGARVRHLRNRRKMTVETLSERTGIGVPQLRLLEKSIDELRAELEAYDDQDDMDLGAINLTPFQVEQVANISLPTLHRLATALEAHVTELLGEGAPTQPAKSAAREAETWRQLLAKARAESLKARAAQYDVTFREYEHLRAELVDAFIQGQPIHAKRNAVLQTVLEQDFIHALSKLRGIKLP